MVPCKDKIVRQKLKRLIKISCVHFFQTPRGLTEFWHVHASGGGLCGEFGTVPPRLLNIRRQNLGLSGDSMLSCLQASPPNVDDPGCMSRIINFYDRNKSSIIDIECRMQPWDALLVFSCSGVRLSRHGPAGSQPFT